MTRRGRDPAWLRQEEDTQASLGYRLRPYLKEKQEQ